ncbi:MAG: sulfatase, partial [Chloroflexi bacterium]|nr:sulfatase [Chloroflexota bacterium]
MSESRTSFLGHLATGATAGLLAGAKVGILEVLLLVVLKGSLRDLEALFYAVVAYSVFGLVGGLGLGVLGGLWCSVGWRKPGWTRASLWATYAAAVFGPAAFVISKYRVERDLLGENPALTGGVTGTLILLGLLLVVALATLALWFVARWLLARRLRLVARPLGSLGLYAAFVVVAALLSYGPALAGALQGGAKTPAGIPPDLRDRPNVILIMADTLRADRMSSYGYTGNQTPHMDALAVDGVRYTQMSAQASWTKPSVATQLTSLYPSSHQAIRKPDLLPSDVVMISEVLQEAGYHTAGFANNVNVAPTFNFDQGYDEYVFLEPSYHFFASESSSQLAVYQGLRQINERFLSRGKYPQYFYQPAEVVNEHVLPWLESNQDSRFFLFIHYMDPHDPYFAHPFDGEGVARVSTPNPDPAQAAALSQLYDGEVSYLDDYLGRLF